MANRFLKNFWLILFFILFGIFLACMGFEINKESYSSIFITAAGVVAALIGFMGIFFVYKLQNILDIRKHYINHLVTLKNELKLYKNNILIVQYKPDEINQQLVEIQRIIDSLNNQIEHQTTPKKEGLTADSGPYFVQLTELISEFQTLKEIKYILELILENIDFEKEFNPHKDSFLFAICSIILFMIPLTFNNVHILNDDYRIFFDNWIFIKMPVTGLFFGLFFIILKDLASMLTEFFTEY